MKMKKLLIICSFAVLVSGCTKSNIVKGTAPAEPNFKVEKDIKLDWKQIGDDLDQQFTATSDYPMGVSVNYSVDQEKKTMDLTLLVKEDCTPEDAVKYATAVIKGLNDEAAMQDFSYKVSTDDSYGGFINQYTVNLIVMPNGAQASESKWLVNMTIPAGSNEKVVPVKK